MLDFLNLAQEELTDNQLNQLEMRFTVKPTGELNVNTKGQPNTDIIQELMDKSVYLADSDRKFKQQIEQQRNQATDRINLLTICFLGSSFLIAIICFFWTYNYNGNQNEDVSKCQLRTYSGESLVEGQTTSMASAVMK